MTRPRVILGPNGAYHVRARTANREPHLDHAWSAEFMISTLAYFRGALGFKLHAFAVLRDSFEAVIQPAQSGPNISKIMMEIKGSFAYWYNRRLGRRGSVWEKRFRDRLLLGPEDIRAAVAEINLRPSVLGLVSDASLYPWTSLGVERWPMRPVDRPPSASEMRSAA